MQEKEAQQIVIEGQIPSRIYFGDFSVHAKLGRSPSLEKYKARLLMACIPSFNRIMDGHTQTSNRSSLDCEQAGRQGRVSAPWRASNEQLSQQSLTKVI